MTDRAAQALAIVLRAMTDCPSDERAVVLGRARDCTAPCVCAEAEDADAEDESPERTMTVRIRPSVDSAEIDAALEKATQLQKVLSSIEPTRITVDVSGFAVGGESLETTLARAVRRGIASAISPTRNPI